MWYQGGGGGNRFTTSCTCEIKGVTAGLQQAVHVVSRGGGGNRFTTRCTCEIKGANRLTKSCTQ